MRALFTGKEKVLLYFRNCGGEEGDRKGPFLRRPRRGGRDVNLKGRGGGGREANE